METTNEKRILSVKDFLTLPSREQDALVAEHVMDYEWRRTLAGCKVLVPSSGPDAEWGRNWTDPPHGDEHVCRDGLRMVPKYSTDIAQAWQVVDHIRVMPKPANTLEQARIAVTVTETVECAACRMDMWFDTYYYQAPTAPLSICAAALLALCALSTGGE